MIKGVNYGNDAYVGTFKDDYFHGHGAYRFFYIRSYVGTWRDGVNMAKVWSQIST